MESLQKYNKKRDFTKTREPKGKKIISKKKLCFVVQHHIARKDHYDFRLEWKGVLKSFAIPKGPSYHPQDKRLAVMVEDHPFSYRLFEGIIPKGEYGGGTVMVWDEGFWEPLGNPEKDFQKGNIKFLLHGKRLQGMWTLVYYKGDNWLLIKEKDDVNMFSDINEYTTSVKTGRTMEEIAKGIKKDSLNSKKKRIVEGIKISNPEKIIFKKPIISKMDIVSYYKMVGKRMLPFVQKRVISTKRCPNGVEKECFFKKHFENIYKSLGKIRMIRDKEKREDYYYIKDLQGIISEVQMNSFEFHIGGSRVEALNKPDVLVFDLDPDEEIGLQKIRNGVKDLKSVLDELGLVSFLKTSGGKGYHVVVPTKRLKTWTKLKDFAQNIAQLMEVKWPDKYTSNIRKEARKGKIFIDWIRNTKGATTVAPYSLRIRKNASVSMPISFKELDQIKPDGITMKEALKRLKRKDPWEGFFKIDQ